MPNQHVVPHSEGWALRPEGASKDTQVFRTQEQAIQRGREVATTPIKGLSCLSITEKVGFESETATATILIHLEDRKRKGAR